jgi:hypothetical protein
MIAVECPQYFTNDTVQPGLSGCGHFESRPDSRLPGLATVIEDGGKRLKSGLAFFAATAFKPAN